jgi:hypothetical protein
MENDIFLITSVINTGNHPWSYTQIRSVYNPEERFEQTCKTVNSIRMKTKAKIFLIECSELSVEQEEILKNKVDIFVNTFHISDIRKACLNTNMKGYGEVVKCKYAIEILKHKKFNRLFKISGRYFLNDNFDEKNYSQNDFTFLNQQDCFVTVLYSVPYELLSDYSTGLDKSIKYYETRGPIGLETLLPNYLFPKKLIKVLGVQGLVAINNNEMYTN